MQQDPSSEPGDAEPLVILNAEEMAAEYAADLGDARRDRRARKLGVALSQNPTNSLPKLGDEADREAAYRLLNNDDVHWRDLAEPHITQTLVRASAATDGVLVLHDTTDVMMKRYDSSYVREHLISPSSRTQGLRLHVSMCATRTGMPMALGTLAMQPFVHRSEAAARGTDTEAYWREQGGLYDNEHKRWFDGIITSHEMLADLGVRGVHVADRESDSYGILAALAKRKVPFVIRCDTSRKLHDQKLRELGDIEVPWGARGDLRDDKSKALHPARKARIATVTLSAGQVTLRRAHSAKDASWSPDGWEGQPLTLTLNVVLAEERSPPEGEAGVRWLLLTNEPVDTDEQAVTVLESYRRRWLIEELFKACKSGCKLEKRQMDSAWSLLNMIALVLPAAWRLLYIRTIADQEPDAPWYAVLTPLEFKLLRAKNNSRSKSPRMQLTEDATVYQCMMAIARLGGHIASNGRPGWQTLHAGWEKLADWVTGARLMQELLAQG